MLFAILWLYFYTGLLNISLLNKILLPKWHQNILWLFFFLAFAVKIPIFPFYTWLPEAHVEAPTGGSILLAGVLLKLGLYGFLKINLTIFPIATLYYKPYLYVLSFVSILYVSFIIFQQIDLKKIIAYSSIAHMNFVVLGMINNNFYGLQGSIFTMISHGFISSMLFFCIGIIYNRYKEKNILYFSNLHHLMPKFSYYFFFAFIANMGVPGTSSFIGEFLILYSFSENLILLFIISSSLFFSTFYCIWTYNRIFFGKKIIFILFKDLTKNENIILLFFVFFIIFLGIYPNILINLINKNILNTCFFLLNKNV